MTSEKQVIESLLRRLGQNIGRALPPGWGFGLMLFQYSVSGEEGRNMQWVSNAQRTDMIRTLRELATRLELGQAGEPGVDHPSSIDPTEEA